MGCSGSGTTNGTPQNICGDGDFLNMEKDIPGACFFSTEVGSYCGGESQQPFGWINGANEWLNVGAGGGCGVCSSCKGVEQGPGNGLCGYGSGSCSWGGNRMRNRRYAFNGVPLACCRRSKAINGELFCFDANNKTRTCDPIYRGFAQPACVGVMGTYCSDDTETAYQAKWIGTPATKDCLRFVAENRGQIDFYGPVISSMVSRYLLAEGNKITSVQTDGSQYDPFITTIVSVCRDNPGACDDVLKIKCADVTRKELSNNINLASLCGCFMKDIQYESFSQFGIERECDPVCALGTSVHLHDTTSSNTDAKFKKCNQSICVIDDVTLNILAGSVVGDINFSQACSSCSENGSQASCRCYITDTTITAIDSLIGNVSFQQQCGNTPLCYRKAPVLGAPPIQINCDSGEDIAGKTTTESNRINPTRTLWVILGALILIFIVGIMFASTRPPDPAPPIFIPGEPATQSRPMLASSRVDKPRPMLMRK